MSAVLPICLENLMCFFLIFVNFPRRKFFVARFLPSIALTVCALCALNSFFPMTGPGPRAFTYFLMEFGILMALFHSCFEISWEQALYGACTGRATQHLIYSLLNLIALRTGRLLPHLTGGAWQEALRAVLLYLPFCVVFYFVFAKQVDTFHYKMDNIHRNMHLLSVVILFVCIGITRFVKGVETRDKSAFIAHNLYAITCCLLCLIMQFQLCRQAELAQEMEMVRMLWKEDSKQLAERKETIELINMKCHDIRHKLEDYHFPLTDGEVSELQSLVNIYDQSYHTGSRTLDVLLVDRALLCEKNHIQLSFMGDGGCLTFLSEAEVYSLFGNALNNAVKASCEVEEAKRQISLIIQHSGDLVSVSMTNYYRGELHFEEELPMTTNLDPQNLHGYGMKSMRSIVKKYGGELKVKAENGIFTLTAWLMNKEDG